MNKISTFVALILFSIGSFNAHAVENEWQAKAEIQQLVNNYALYRDTFNAQAFGNLFTEDARANGPAGETIGRAAISKRVENADRNRVVMHLMTTGQITLVDDNNATGTHYVSVYSKTLDAPRKPGQVIPLTDLTGMAMFTDKYVKTDEGWRISERVIDPIFEAPK